MNDYQFLRKIKRKKNFDYETASDLEKEALIRLTESKHVSFYIDEQSNHYIYQIRSLGENYIYEEKKLYRRWFITTVISVCALIISIYALFT